MGDQKSPPNRKRREDTAEAGATALNHMDPSKEPGSTVWGQDIYHDEGWLHKRVTKAGTGALPPPGALVHVKYEGKFLDGNTFDQSEDFNFQIGFNRVILGWDKGLASMQVGEQAVLRCAPEMAYGKDGNDVIPAQSTLVFDIEVLGWEDSNSVGGPDVMGLLIAGMVVLACAAPFLRDYL